MANFPVLSSGAITQYPAPVSSGMATQVIRFLDGSDQRYLMQGQTFRSWEIRLDLLNFTEVQQVEAFFMSQQGDYGLFSFPDPFSSADIPNCRLGSPGLVTEYVGEDINAASFWVIETYG